MSDALRLDLKNCANCRSEFEPDTNKRKLCVSCRSQRSQNYYQRNKEQIKAKVLARYYKNYDKIRADQAEYREKTGYNSKYYAENKEHLRSQAQAAHRANPGKKYGLSKDEYWAMVDRQAGLCAICNVVMERVCVDHNHATKQVRGLLCHHCNVTLGLMKEDPERLERAAEYIRSHV